MKRQEAIDRAGGRCEAGTPECRGTAEHVHHRRLRSQGGKDDLDNLMAVCGAGGCHDYIHAHPAESYERGWLLRTGQPMTIYRRIPAGEAVPDREPDLRYTASTGYIILRWRTGPGQYAEAAEHRIFGGAVTAAEHVHHINGDKTDNRQENLQPMSAAEHGATHRRVDRQAAAALYTEGMTQAGVAAALGCDPSQVSRALKAEGVPVRPGPPNKAKIDGDEVVRLFNTGLRPDAIAAELGCSRSPVDRVLRERGIPRHRPGRPGS